VPLSEEKRPKGDSTWEDEDTETSGTLYRCGVEPAGAAQNEGQGNQDADEQVDPDKGHKRSGYHLDHWLLWVLQYYCVSVAADN
jgi:hypothetical protein